MRIRCAWCKEVFGEKPPLEDKDFTDGICIQCMLSHFPDVYQAMYGNVPPDKLKIKGVSNGKDIPRNSQEG